MHLVSVQGRTHRGIDNETITDTRAYWQLTAAAALWGFSWICGRVISSEGIPAIHASLVRFLIGSAGLLGVMFANRPWPGIGASVAPRLFAMGFFGVFLYNICFFNGLRTVPAGRASLMAALQPSVVFLFSAVVWGETMTPVRVAGLAVSFTGALIVLSGGSPARLFTSGLNTGDLWILGCVLSWVAYTLLGRTLAGRISAGPATAWSTWAGTVLLAAMYLMQPGTPAGAWTIQALLAAAFLGLLGTTVAFLLYLKGIGQIGASRASIFINLVPVFGVFFSAAILREPPGLAALLGGVLVIAGVRLLNR